MFLEIFAVFFAITYLILAVRQNIFCWYAAFFSTAIYTFLYWDVSLYMESILNIYYLLRKVRRYRPKTGHFYGLSEKLKDFAKSSTVIRDIFAKFSKGSGI